MCARLGAYNSSCVELIEKEGAELLAILAKSYVSLKWEMRFSYLRCAEFTVLFASTEPS